MQVRCPISGVIYRIFDQTVIELTHPHPLLSTFADIKVLEEQVYPLFKAGNLSCDYLHLFGIALLQKLPLAGPVSLASQNTYTFEDFWNKLIPKLMPLCRRLHNKTFKDLPTINANLETLSYLPYWIDELHEALNYATLPISDEARRLNRESYKSSLLNESLDLSNVPVSSWTKEEKDALILRGIRGSQLTAKESSAFPQLIADWADAETKFPVTAVRLAEGKRTTTKAVWQGLITRAVKAGSSYLDLVSSEFTLEDIQDLEAHLLAGLKSSSMQSKFLFEKLAEATEILEEFSGVPKVSSVKTKVVEAGQGSILDLSLDLELEESSELATKTKDTPKEIYNTNHQPGERTLSLKEMLAIKLAKAKGDR
jgi:hypothetical protein